MRKLRLAAGYAAIAGTIPYLTLKFSWILGGTLGLVDPEVMTTPQLRVGNVFTAGMDLVAILVALAFTHDWGKRLPAWLVLFPAWVGTGFLAPIALSAPVIGLDLALVDRPADVLQPWVLPVVYGSFAWQGCTLLTAFALYARDRWARLFTARRLAGRVGAVGGTGAALAVLTGAVHLWWAVSANALPATRFVEAVVGALALLVAGTLVAGAATRPPRGTWWPLAALWTGSAVMFSDGFWGVVTLVETTGRADLAEVLVGLGQPLGAVLLVAVLLAKARDVAEDAASRRTRQTVPQG